jgi:anion-transporting  ArsA/GET3 family ATPase
MAGVLERKLIVVSGKGGVGKTTIAAALGLVAARRGLRTIVVEVGGQRRLADMFAYGSEPRLGEEVQVTRDLWSLSIDPDAALREWLAAVAGRIPAGFLTSRATFQYFVAAAPGADELVGLVKVSELTTRRRRRAPRASGYDLVILDAPATGHALAMLSSPRTFTTIVRVGPMATQAREVLELLCDPQRSAYVAVTHPSELAVTETLELAGALAEKFGRELEAVVLNGTVPRRFSAAELARLRSLTESSPPLPSAISAAQMVTDRARNQQRQAARLRRRGLPLLRVPFRFQGELDRDSLAQIADQLQREL